MPESTERARFYRLIDDARPRRARRDPAAELETLGALLAGLDDDDLLGAAARFRIERTRLRRHGVWAAARRLSTDSAPLDFDAFCAWIIAKGEIAVKAMQRDSDQVVDYLDQEVPERGEMVGVLVGELLRRGMDPATVGSPWRDGDALAQTPIPLEYLDAAVPRLAAFIDGETLEVDYLPEELLIPASTPADLERLVTLLREWRIPALLEVDEVGEPGGVISARLLAGYGEQILAMDTMGPAFRWVVVEPDVLAAELVAVFGPGVCLDGRVWAAGGAVPWPLVATHPDPAVREYDSDDDEDLESTTGFAAVVDSDMLTLRMLARTTGDLTVLPLDDGSDRCVVWTEAVSGREGTAALGVLPHSVAMFRSETRRGIIVGAMDRTVVHIWDDEPLVVDPSAGFRADDSSSVRDLLAGLRDPLPDPREAVDLLALDDDRASRFRALWRERGSDATTFTRFADIVGIPSIAADIAESGASEEVLASASTIVGASTRRIAWEAFHDDIAGTDSRGLWWFRFSARHPVLRWTVVVFGLVVTATAGVWQLASGTWSWSSWLLVAAFAIWVVDALVPRRWFREAPPGAAGGGPPGAGTTGG